MSSLPIWADAVIAAGGGAAFAYPVLAWLSGRFTRNVRHVAEEVVDAKLKTNNALTADIKERVVRIEAQFGSNGGGLRQAVNEVQIAVAELRGELHAGKTTMKQ